MANTLRLIGENHPSGNYKVLPYGCDALRSKTLILLRIVLLIQMAIQYERTMKITYGKNKLPEVTFNKLVGDLAKKEMYVVGMYDNYTNNQFGYTSKDITKTTYAVMSPEYGTIMTLSWVTDAKAIIEGFKNIIDGIELETISTVTSKKEWIAPEGTYAAFPQDKNQFDGDSINLEGWGKNSLEYDNGAILDVRVRNEYSGLILQFNITWAVETIQRKDKIEEAMVQTVLSDMGKIQSIFEGRIKQKKFGLDIEDVIVDCHFNAKTESRSECAPDIIQQVRKARTS